MTIFYGYPADETGGVPIIEFFLPAGEVYPSPPVGPELGQLGLNIMNFCIEFNKATKHLKGHQVMVRLYKDNDVVSFRFSQPIIPEFGPSIFLEDTPNDYLQSL